MKNKIIMPFSLIDLYNKLMNLLLKFANHGVIHGDYNEFNIMIGNYSWKFFKN